MPQSFWKRSAKEVANSMRGMTLRVGNKEAIIIDASAYERDDDDRGLYKPMHDMKPGGVYCPRLMNSILLCIITGKGKTVGGRVRIDDIEMRGVRHQGPGIVASVLGVNQARAHGSARLVDELTIELNIDDYPVRVAFRPARKRQLPASPAISKKSLAKLLPQIVEKYLREDPPSSFDAYLNMLLAECGTVGKLRRKISS